MTQGSGSFFNAPQTLRFWRAAFCSALLGASCITCADPSPVLMQSTLSVAEINERNDFEQAPLGWFAETRLAVVAPDDIQQRRYKLGLTATLRTGGENSFAIDPGSLLGTDIRLAGAWTIALTEVSGEYQTVRAQLELTEFEVTAPETPIVSPQEYRARLRADVCQPFWLKVGPAGVEGVVFYPQIAPVAANIQRALAAITQVSRRIDGVVRESDSAGTYEARYRRIDAETLERTKISYPTEVSEYKTDEPPHGPVRIVASLSQVRFSSSMLAGLIAHDELVLETGDGLPSMRSKALWTLDLENESTVPRSVFGSEGLPSSGWMPLHGNLPSSAYHFEIDLSKVGQYRRIQEILGALNRIAADDPEASNKRKRLQIAASALLRLRPGELKVVRTLLIGREKEREFLLTAVARAGTSEAQQLAVEVLLKPSGLQSNVRGGILVTLSLASQPSGELIKGIQRLLEDPDLRPQALLGLGSIAFRLGSSDREGARRVVGVLLDHLAAATRAGSFEEVQVVMRALGNAGHADSIVALEPYLNAHQGVVRAAAIAALRRVVHPTVDVVLASYASSDADERVREAARRVTSERLARLEESQ